MPENWVQHPVVNTEEGSNPGAPLAWGSPGNPDDAVAGYGYVPCDTSEVEETFYYHSDHLGSTAYITDQKANVTQYDAYLPYGELLVDEHSSSKEMPYKFNGKELDEETGLYYYGARYMNPIASIWYGVDPLTEKYPNVSAFVYCMGNPVKLIDMDGLSPDSACAAAMAQVSYNENTRDTKRNIAYLKQHHWFKYKNYKNEKNGFKAAVFVYQPDKESGITEWAIAYAGTDDLLDVKEDVKNFLGQTTTQQFDAVGLANKIEEYAQGREITFIGHSLGGDLAITVSSWTPHDAIVFNPASTCFLTRLEGRILGRGHGKVTQYRTFGDPLGVFQDMIPTKKAPGKRHYVKGNTHSVQHFNNQFRK